MLRTKLLIAALSAVALTSACAPVVGQNGFQAIDAILLNQTPPDGCRIIRRTLNS